ncbi:MAG: hypothetical protein IID61_16090 [SAR324 cluster bacterium]|nr:hypothetical protein [SAR324 cluster bacterium]
MHTAGGALKTGAGIEQEFALFGEPDQLLAQHPAEALVETHGVDRRHDLAPLDPERGEAGHAGDAAVVAVRNIAVPQVIEIEPGAQPLERFLSRQIPRCHIQRFGRFDVGGYAEFLAVASPLAGNGPRPHTTHYPSGMAATVAETAKCRFADA